MTEPRATNPRLASTSTGIFARLPFCPVKRLLDFHFFQQEVADYSPEPVILKFQIIDLAGVLDAVGNCGLRFSRSMRQGVSERGKFSPAVKRHDADTKGFAGDRKSV